MHSVISENRIIVLPILKDLSLVFTTTRTLAAQKKLRNDRVEVSGIEKLKQSFKNGDPFL